MTPGRITLLRKEIGPVTGKTGRILAISAVAMLALVAPPARGGQSLPASEKTRKEVVKLADAIETNPLAKSSRKQRTKALQLIDGAQDLKLVACRALLGELMLSKKLGAIELRAHLQIAAARYLSDHEGASGSDVETAVAGLEGVVRAYESMRRNDLRVSIPEADAIVELYNAGNLTAYAADALSNCGR